MFKKIYKHLKNKGFNVYSIGQHQGLCIEPFLVIFEKGPLQTTEKNIIKDLFEIYVFYPIGKYSKVSEYKISVESVMDEIVGIKQAYEALPILIDDEKQAYFTRLSYYENKQIRR